MIRILLLLGSPFLSAACLLLIRRHRSWVRAMEAMVVISACIEFITAMTIVSLVVTRGSFNVSSFFSVHAFGALVLVITVVVGLAATLHSVGYLRVEQEKGMIGVGRLHQCHLLMRIFLLSMYVAIMTTNPIVMWIAIETTTLSTVFLISFFNRPSDVEAAWKYLIINSVGLLLGLLGTILFLAQAPHGAGLTSWDSVMAVASRMNPSIVKLAFGLVLIGYGTKMGLVPMHTWKPDAYNKAPLPVAALLSGALANVAFLAILRFKLVTDIAVGNGFTQPLFIFFGLLSMVIPAFIMYSQGNFKRLFAYSSVEHAGIMMLGFGFGGIGIFGALLHMMYHACTKALMFLLSSNVAVRYGSSKISDISGMLQVMPYTSVLYIIGFLSLAGMPPFGIFFSEFYIALAGFMRYPWLSIVYLALLLLVFAALLRHIASMLFGMPPEGMIRVPFNPWMLIPVTVLAAIIIVSGLYAPHNLFILLRESVQTFQGTLI